MKLKDILRDREKGSGELLKETVAWLERHPDTLDEMQLDFTLALLRKTRPAMAGFGLLADRIESALQKTRALSPASVLHDISRSIERAEENTTRRFVELLRARGPGRALTLSWSSAVLRALEAAGDLVSEVGVMESQPGGEGARLYEALVDTGKNARLFPDEKLAEAADWANFGLIGADTVFPDGAVLNKVLSREMAEEMKRRQKPFYVLATEWKRAPQASAEYQLEPHGQDVFEIVPAALITALLAD